MYKIESDKQLDCAFVLLEYYEKRLNPESRDFDFVLGYFIEVLDAICDYLI